MTNPGEKRAHTTLPELRPPVLSKNCLYRLVAVGGEAIGEVLRKEYADGLVHAANCYGDLYAACTLMRNQHEMLRGYCECMLCNAVRKVEGVK